MDLTSFRKMLLAAVLVLTAFWLARPAMAQPAEAAEIRSACVASGALSESFSSVINAPERWYCGKFKHSIEPERVFLRFDVGPDTARPAYFYSRRAAHEALHFWAIDADGAVRQLTYSPSDLQNALSEGFFKAALPEITPATRQVIAAIDRPTHRMTLERAYLAADDSGALADYLSYLLILAALSGMLIMPLVFNAVFFRILREPFVLWHSALTISLMLTILVSSGLAAIVFDVPAMTLSWMATLVFGASVASGAMFTYSFIEPGMIHPLLRRALPWCAALAISLSSLHAAFPFVARTVQSPVYTALFAPILVIFLLALVDALRRGGRAAKFQVVGWAPMVGVGLTRIVTGLFPAVQSNDAMLLFYVGCVCEVMSTALGVADRFMTLKRQRDHARGEAEMLEYLSERDALTDLLNRRVIETRFEAFRAEGFNTLAVLDLDHFKSINDVHGHKAGDLVLKAAAGALQADSDIRAFRIGGEEFVLLIKGEDTVARAERRRQAIPAIVARAVPGLQRPVTASMGVVSLSSQDGVDRSLSGPYERADRLLYEAKSAGRNRSVVAIQTSDPAHDDQVAATA